MLICKGMVYSRVCPTRVWRTLDRAVLPILFSTSAHFLGTAHQTAHCIYGTYFIYKTYILLHFFSFIIKKSIKFVFTKLNRSFLQAVTSVQSVGKRNPVGDKIAL